MLDRWWIEIDWVCNDRSSRTWSISERVVRKRSQNYLRITFSFSSRENGWTAEFSSLTLEHVLIRSKEKNWQARFCFRQTSCRFANEKNLWERSGQDCRGASAPQLLSTVLFTWLGMRRVTKLAAKPLICRRRFILVDSTVRIFMKSVIIFWGPRHRKVLDF